MTKNQKGFTLIELLIVIVIIGILAGVLIAIIDPQAQQNRARDAGVQASINKVALATQGFISAYGRVPEGDEFIAALDNASDESGGASCIAGAATCLFSITGNALPALCDAAGNGWDGVGAAQCNYWYTSPAAGQFQLYARSFGINNTTFQYDNVVGGMSQCDEDGANCVAM